MRKERSLIVRFYLLLSQVSLRSCLISNISDDSDDLFILVNFTDYMEFDESNELRFNFSNSDFNELGSCI